jgi:uncharacterized protein YacL
MVIKNKVEDADIAKFDKYLNLLLLLITITMLYWCVVFVYGLDAMYNNLWILIVGIILTLMSIVLTHKLAKSEIKELSDLKCNKEDCKYVIENYEELKSDGYKLFDSQHYIDKLDKIEEDIIKIKEKHKETKKELKQREMVQRKINRLN